MQLGDVDREKKWGCNTFKGTRKTHNILGFSKIDNTQLLCRSLSCFCSYCMDDEWNKCTTMEHSGSWTLKKLEPSEASDAAPIANEESS